MSGRDQSRPYTFPLSPHHEEGKIHRCSAAWFLHWYTVNYFLTVDTWRTAVASTHFVAVGQISGADNLIQKYGENIAQNQYSGEDLAKGGFIQVPQDILYWWLGLVAVTLLAIKLDDLRVYGKAVGYLKQVLDWAKILTLLLQIGWVLWFCVQSTQLRGSCKS